LPEYDGRRKTAVNKGILKAEAGVVLQVAALSKRRGRVNKKPRNAGPFFIILIA
jgi:hypothetical protein